MPKRVVSLVILTFTILFLLFSAGLISYTGGKFDLFIFPQYIKTVDYPLEVGEQQKFQIDILIQNPTKQYINPELEINFQSEKWRTNNKYLINNERIPVGVITSKSFLKYSTEFNFNFVYFLNNNQLTSTQVEFERKNNPFEVKLFVDGKEVDSEEVNIHVQEKK